MILVGNPSALVSGQIAPGCVEAFMQVGFIASEIGLACGAIVTGWALLAMSWTAVSAVDSPREKYS